MEQSERTQVLMQHLGPYPIIFVGDDRTDEDAFMKLKNTFAIALSRKPGESAASYYLKSTSDVARFLRLSPGFKSSMDKTEKPLMAFRQLKMCVSVRHLW